MLLGFPGTSVDSEVRSLFSVFARLVCAVEDFFDRAVPPKGHINLRGGDGHPEFVVHGACQREHT